MSWIARKGFVLVMLGLCAVGLGWGANWMRSTKLRRAPQTPRVERAQVRLVSHTPREIVIEFESPLYEALKDPETGEVVQFSVKGAQSASRTGFPVVPSLVQPVDCPPGEIRLQIVEMDEETHPLPLFRGAQEDQPIDPTDRGLTEVAPRSRIQGRRLEGTTPEPSAEVWPLRAVELYEGGFFRGHRLMAVQYHPLRVDSRRRVVKWVPRIRVRLILPDWEGSPDYANRRHDAPNERALLEHIVGPLAPAVLPTHQIEERQRPALGIQTEFSPRFKIIVDEEGVYHIGQEMLASAGVPVEQIDPRTIKVKVRGHEIPIFVQGEADGVFDPYEYIEFYGIENRETWTSLDETLYKDPWSDENVYWFSWAGPYGLRLGEQNAEWAPNVGSPTPHVQTTVHFEEDNYFNRLSGAGLKEPYKTTRLQSMGPYGMIMDNWFYSTGVRAFETKDHSVFIAHPDTTSLQQVVVRVALQGLSYLDPDQWPPLPPETGHHRAIVYVNGFTDRGLTRGKISEQDDEEAWKDQTAVILQTIPDASNPGITNWDLRHGENTVSLSATGDGLAPADRIALNWVEITYERMMKAWDGYIRFDFDATLGETFELDIRGFRSPNIQVWKLGRARLTNTDVRYLTPVDEDPSWAVRFLVTPTQAYRLIAFDDTYLKTPVAILPEQSTRDLRDLPGAEYILLVHDSFLEEPAIEALRQRREGTFSGGVEVVTPTEIYEQFNAGIVNPEAIRNFLIYAYDHWTVRPTHLCIVGDGNYDVKDYRHYGGNLIPGLYTWTRAYGRVSCDCLFGCVSGPPTDIIPDIAVGRISCRTAEELETYVEKIAVYEDDPDYNSSWHSNYIFMADKEDYPFNFALGFSEPIVGVMPDYVNITRVYSDSLPSRSQRETAVREAFRKGGIIVNYNGHGGGGQWAAEDLLNWQNESLLLNRRKYPFITSFTCYTNAYDEGRQGEVLGEAFLFQRNVNGELIGGIGVYAACGLSWAFAGIAQQGYLFDFLADPPGQTLGEVVQINKTRFWLPRAGQPLDMNNYCSQHLLMNLLGDPGVKLAIPQNVFEPEIDKIFVMAPMDSIVLDTVVLDPANPDSIRIDTVEIITIPGDTVLISGTLPFDIGEGHVVQAWYDLYEDHKVRLVEESLFPEIITTQDFESPPLVVPRSFTTAEARYVVYVSNPATQEDGIGCVSIYADDLGDSTLFLNPGPWPGSVLREGIPFYVQVKILHRIGIDRVRMRGVFNPPSGPFILDTLAMQEVAQYLWRTPISLGPYDLDQATYNVSFTAYDDSGSAISSPTYALQIAAKPDIAFSGSPVIGGDTYPHVRVMLQKMVPEHSTLPNTLTMYVFGYRTATPTLPADTLESYATITGLANLGQTFTVDIPVHFRPGRWILRIYIDPFDEIAESNEINLRSMFLVADHFPISRAEGIYYEDPHESNVSNKYWRLGTPDTLVLRIPPGALLKDSSVVCYEYPRKFTVAESLFFARVLGPNAGLRQLPADQRPDIFNVTLSDSTDRLAPGSAADVSLIRDVSVGTIAFADTVGSRWPSWPPPDTSDRDIYQRRLGTDYWTKMETSRQATRDSVFLGIDTVWTPEGPYYLAHLYSRSYRMRYSTRTNYLGSFTIFTLDRGSMDIWPPQVDLAVNGERYVPGAYVPTNPQMFFYLSDPSGIDRRPEYFRIVLDGDTIPYGEIAWTDSVETSGDQVALIRPHLSLGDHTLEVYARDNLGNDTTCVTAFQVEGTFGIDFALNYPNPFNTQTKIVYVLTGQTDEYVKVKIYTVSGRLIRTLRESERAVINYRTLVWDGRDEAGEFVANGVYFGRIIASQGGKQVEKVIKMARVR